MLTVVKKGRIDHAWLASTLANTPQNPFFKELKNLGWWMTLKGFRQIVDSVQREPTVGSSLCFRYSEHTQRGLCQNSF